MPQGMLIGRWDDRLGVTAEASFPANLIDLLEHDDLLTIFSTHAITEKPGILAMRIKRLNIVSYYSGLPEGEQTEQYFVVVVLNQDEDPSTYDERLTEISKLIILSVNKPGFQDLLAEYYDRFLKMEKISEEQRYAFIFQDLQRRLVLSKLTNGPMTKEGLAKWLSKEIDKEVTDINGLLGPLRRTQLIEEVNISRGKKVNLEYVFLMRDIAVIRVPNVEIFRAAKGGQVPKDIRDKYVEDVENFFKEYRISTNDAGLLGDVVSNPDTYDIVNVLRKEYCTRAELGAKLPRQVENLPLILKDLAEKKIITAVKDKKGRIWVFLLSDIKFPNFFPEYMVDVIRRRWKEGTIAKEIALRHLELLRAEYIATQAPKYRKKLLKNMQEFFGNAEQLIRKQEYDQAATIIDNMASLARDMGERGFAELLDEVGKLTREDKDRYIEEKFDEHREQIIEYLQIIEAKDKRKEKASKAEMEIKKSKAVKGKGKKAQDYKDAEELEEEGGADVDVAEREKFVAAEATMEKKIKEANKKKDYKNLAKLYEAMAKIKETLGKKAEALDMRDKARKVKINLFEDARKATEKEAKMLMGDGDYEAASEKFIYCAKLSKAMVQEGIAEEESNVKKFMELARKAKEM